jgi:hypothetical protein
LCLLPRQAGVARAAAGGGAPGDGPSEGAPRIHSMNVGAGGAGDMQVLEEQRMAAIESPAGKRDTLGDKVSSTARVAEMLSRTCMYASAYCAWQWNVRGSPIGVPVRVKSR